MGLPARTVAVRRRLLGDAVDEGGRVTEGAVALSWLGVSTFACAVGGHVVLLDAWIPRGLAAAAVPATARDLVDLRPAVVLVGHGHFDHAADLAAVVAGADPLVVAAPALLDRLARRLRRRPRVVPALDADAPVGGLRHLEPLPGLRITAVRHLHSAPVLAGGSLRRAVLPRPSAAAIVRRPPRPRDVVHLAAHLGDRCGPCVLYQLRVDGFTLTWHDTSGPLPQRAPRVLDVLADLPPSDVVSSAVMGFNQVLHGLGDPVAYASALRARALVPNHHDHWLPPITAPGAVYEPPLREALAALPAGARPALRFITDPGDYARPWR